MDRNFTLALILGCPLLIRTKFKVHSRQQFAKGQQTQFLCGLELVLVLKFRIWMEVCLVGPVFSRLYVNIALTIINQLQPAYY
jgi:hypothetical protein